MTILRVTYMELRESPSPPPQRSGPERIAREHLDVQEYLAMYREVGAPLRWDQRLQIPESDLVALLNTLSIYVLRGDQPTPLGFCELDRQGFPDIEIKNFGLIPAAQGRGLGPWLLATACHQEWHSKSNPQRIWLHTDSWDHPAAVSVYERLGFKVYDIREEESGPL